MDDKFNVTYITFNGYVEVQNYRYLYFFIMITVYFLIIFYNSTIVYLIWKHKNLHEPMYIFIAALLINSVILSSAVYPKYLIDFLSDRQIISYSACLFQFFTFYAIGSSEFLLLSVMAYDRYVSICNPLQYPSIMRKNTVCIFLLLAWLVPACHIAIPAILSAKSKLCSFTLKAIFCNNTIYRLQCVSSRVITIYGVVTLVDLAVLPLLFIIFTYAKILFITYRSCKEVKKKAAETCLPHLLVLISYSCLCAYDISIARVESNFPKTARFIMMLQTVFYNPLLNPLIYGLKMKEISKHLKKLFLPAKTPLFMNTDH
ncbi:olfactory receptor 4N2-like [Labrus bergylta]|uniref:Olfactory receptor n=1 Tax=Labrus bergylta TaxID=56723 RepID=A0A3Q3GC67_9LABR|nr:olfactory receptor 4N2-like [Labrus bergylta]